MQGVNASLPTLTLDEWDERYARLRGAGLHESWYGGPLSRHVKAEGDLRLKHLRFDESAAALRLWNFLLTENQRLREARRQGEKLVGTMKDLGTIPVLAFALPGVRAFYPDGAWWTPCLMECSDQLLARSEALGIDASFCPVRAMLPAFQCEGHFPRPDLLICGVGAVCDDFSAIAQRLEALGHEILWWEIPRRRAAEGAEVLWRLPGGVTAPEAQVHWVRDELRRVAGALEEVARVPLRESTLEEGIRAANRVRKLLRRLRQSVYGAECAPLPSLEMLVIEMLAIHFCSDRAEAIHVLTDLLVEVESRAARGACVVDPGAIRVFWVNPVADLRAMNLLEECGGRLCGSEFMFRHALDAIPEDLPGLEALACMALADPMVGPTEDRALRIVRECREFQVEALVVSRIPGASHCAREGEIIREMVQNQLGIPTIELEITPVCDAMLPSIGSRLEALMETARARRMKT